MDNSDTLWDHLFEDESQQTHYPLHLRTILPNCGATPPESSQSSARSLYGPLDWMGDAANNGDVLVVCGGWHAPALAKIGANVRR